MTQLNKTPRPLNKREQKKLLRKAHEKKDKRKETVANILFLLGIFLIVFLCIYSHIQFHWTIIDYKIPFAVFILSGIVFGHIFKIFVRKILTVTVIKAQVFWNYFSAGAIVTAMFFFVNNLLVKPEVYSIEAPILESYYTSLKSGRSKGVAVDVELPDFTKQLHFPLEAEDSIDRANVILLKVSKGGLGFEVIRDRIPCE